MATKPLVSDEASSKTRSAPQPSMLLMTAVVVAGVWIGTATMAAVFYMALKSGRLPVPGAGPATGQAAGAAKANAVRAMVLEPILVNLADEGGHAYLRLGLTIDVEEEPVASGGKNVPNSTATGSGATGSGATVMSDEERSVRDRVLTVLGRQTSSYLLGPDGKEHLKLELREEIERDQRPIRIKNLFFTDFLVQI